ncbi:MAG: UDP-N-acetylmuramoyl-L-alanyl-D-glutamate--2,6-diaminopimelate ligase, partial [Flavobacteriaceae bacterium]|nr:UDP-N-acetylmuramoyl-L-alanyl-D-glutamate--2,6-diaminopimelate ligase [Flavobacteriaceae bacterium]
MKELKELLYGVSIDAVHGSTAIQINQVTADSRIVEDQDLFVAISGVAIDGHTFIEKAIKNGARAVVCERIPSDLAEKSKVTFIRVDNSRKSYGIIASNYYDNPSASFKVIAVTGTNGKTSVSSMLFALFQKLGHNCGLVSTIDIRVGTEILKTSHTTPDAMQLHKVFHQMKSKGVAFCFMEASSHGIHQFRLSGIDVDAAVFTN